MRQLQRTKPSCVSTSHICFAVALILKALEQGSLRLPQVGVSCLVVHGRRQRRALLDVRLMLRCSFFSHGCRRWPEHPSTSCTAFAAPCLSVLHRIAAGSRTVYTVAHLSSEQQQ
jgi:hypothetical protein